MAHRKAGGSAKNLRDSKAQRLGVKLFGGQKTTPGMIILRQRGTKWFPGEGVKRGNDDTLYALKSGFVKFSRRKKIKFHGSLAWQKLVSVVDKIS